MTDNQIIIDHGSYYTKYGYAGYNKPQSKIRSRLYQHKVNKTILTHATIIEKSIGYKDLIAVNVIKNGVIVDFLNIIHLWKSIFEDLKMTSKLAPLCTLLITEPLFVPSTYHETLIKAIQTLFTFK